MVRKMIIQSILGAAQISFPNIEIPKINVEAPHLKDHGDYSTNLPLVLAKTLKKNPMETASSIAKRIKEKDSKLYKKIEIALPGFINFWISDKTLEHEFKGILKKKHKYGQGIKKKEKTNLEFISANPTGPLTLGNGRGAFLGDALARTLSFFGFRVTREYYINDARKSNQIQELGRAILKNGNAYPGPYTDEIRRRLAKKYENFKNLGEEDVGFKAAGEIQKDNRKFIEKVLKIHFDVWYSEEGLYKKNLIKKFFEELKKNGLVYEKDGAWWFRASQFGDSEDRVAIRTGGAPTYFLPDIAYHAEKLSNRKFDTVIDILGADHHGTFPRVVAGLRALGFDVSRIKIIFTQIVRLVRGGQEVKMSKRKGVYVTLEELIKEVGLDVARFFFVATSPDTHMDFDLDLAKERSLKNPVYYIQYAHARISSVLRKAKIRPQKNSNFFKEKEEIELVKKLIQFPEIVEDTAEDYQVIRLTRYAVDLARIFHNFYEKHRVIGKDKKTTQSRLKLVYAAQIVLKLVLGLLGISAPTKM